MEMTGAIRLARSSEDVAAVRGLFREYERELGVDLSFQDFAEEVRDLPGKYAPPEGCLLLAEVSGEIAGCVGLRPFPFESATGEMKRLFVRAPFRACGLGRALTEACIAAAREAGYHALRLDTLPSMAAAAALYRSLGFVPAPPAGPRISGQLFLVLPLG